MAISVDLLGELWPALSATAPATGEDVDMDLVFASILHIVQGPTVQRPTVEGFMGQAPAPSVVPAPALATELLPLPQQQQSKPQTEPELQPRPVPAHVEAATPLAPSSAPAPAVLPDPPLQAAPVSQPVSEPPRPSPTPGLSPAESFGPTPDAFQDLRVRPGRAAHTVTAVGITAPPTADATSKVPVTIVSGTFQRQTERGDSSESPEVKAPASDATRPPVAGSLPVEPLVMPTAVDTARTAPAPVTKVPDATTVHDIPAPAAQQQALVPTTDDGAPVMPRLVELMRWQARDGGGHAELRLRPEFLGAVTVSIVVEKGAVKATVSAETSAALEYLRSEASGLQEALEERGLTLDEFEVREESPLTERRQDAEDKKQRQESAPAPRRRPVSDSDAVFNVLV